MILMISSIFMIIMIFFHDRRFWNEKQINFDLKKIVLMIFMIVSYSRRLYSFPVNNVLKIRI